MSGSIDRLKSGDITYAATMSEDIRKMAEETAMAHLSLVHDDVLLAYQRFSPPPVLDPNYVPPKRTWRIRFRVWRHQRNHAIQQWIHDHLTEAYCDD